MAGLGEIIIVAGPNGAGKTSFAERFLPMQLRSYRYFNADEIARALRRAGFPPEQVDARAGREIINQIRSAVALGEDVMLETTLSGRGWARHIPMWKAQGYAVRLYYLRLPNADAAVDRVSKRVATGGHDIPEAVVRRRFARSLVLLERLYMPVVDSWYVFDSVEDHAPRLADSGGSNVR